MDILHEVDKRIVYHMLEFTKTSLKLQIGKAGIQEWDYHFSLIPKYTGLSQFQNGISSLTSLTGSDHREIARVCSTYIFYYIFLVASRYYLITYKFLR